MPTPMASPTAIVTITINGMSGASSFSPSPASVTVGQLVRWRNANSVVHTATQDGGGFETGPIAPGVTSTPRTLSAGTLGYHCSIHPSMVGTLVGTR
jgi:plastocyanin